MNDGTSEAGTRHCPMCGAAVAAIDRTCAVCGETLIDADGSMRVAGEGISELEIRKFVGGRADYYVDRWQRGQRASKRGPGFNWAALLFTGLWLPYRKMYVATLILYAVVLTESIAEQILFVTVLGNNEVPTIVDRLTGLMIAMICGVYGNSWYLAHVRKNIENLKAQELPEEAYLQSLAKRGGTNIWASFGCFALFVAANIAVFTGLELLTGGE